MSEQDEAAALRDEVLSLIWDAMAPRDERAVVAPKEALRLLLAGALRQARKEATREALEQAAKIADGGTYLNAIAEAIRALIPPPPPSALIPAPSPAPLAPPCLCPDWCDAHIAEEPKA